MANIYTILSHLEQRAMLTPDRGSRRWRKRFSSGFKANIKKDNCIVGSFKFMRTNFREYFKVLLQVHGDAFR